MNDRFMTKSIFYQYCWELQMWIDGVPVAWFCTHNFNIKSTTSRK